MPIREWTAYVPATDLARRTAQTEAAPITERDPA
jgi:hypothetical protein